MARKRGMQFIPYDYEAAYNKAMEDMHESRHLNSERMTEDTKKATSSK